MPYPVAAARGNKVSGAGGLTFLLRDDFLSDAAAPLASPRTAEPGPGTLTITDTNSKLSVASGKLTFATGGVAAGNPGVWESVGIAHSVGLAIVAQGNQSVSGLEIGLDANQAGAAISTSIRLTGAILGIRMIGFSALEVGAIATSTDYQVAVVARSDGAFYLIKGGAFTLWTLVYVSVVNTSTPLYPSLVAATTTAVATLEFLRALQLTAPFTDDYGIATQRLAGAQSAGQTFTHEANCVLEFVVTTVPSVGIGALQFRIQDSDNLWDVTFAAGGTFNLRENVAGVYTTRATAVVLADGHRVVIVCDGTTIRGYSNNVLRWTYSSASNFATATAGRLNSLATGGAVSDIISWPRTLGAEAAALLDAAVA